MSYVKLHPVKQLDFQINRILTYGDVACNFEEVKNAANAISDLGAWYKTWRGLGERAEADMRFMHAAYYYRLAEFFLSESPEKEEMYQRSMKNFRKRIGDDQSVTFAYVPYQDAAMKTMVFRSDKATGTLVVFGGYDSFIEEFYLPVKELAGLGYTVYLFEGPGQGETLKRGLTFEPHWEKPLGAIIEYFGLQDVCVVGISWGGYLALRAAAYDKRITKVVAYDVLYDGFDCMTNPFPNPLKAIFRFLFELKAKALVNALINRMAKKRLMILWAVSHGQYITGTKTPYDFYTHLMKHSLKGILPNIQCDVLLLAGEKDHYISASHYERLMSGLVNAKTVTGRVFTEDEGGAEHCQIGNHRMAIQYILGWLDNMRSITTCS